ncbi:MAG: hypothetical protein JRZ94_05360 [Nitrososphaerota archaeon]|nr:hypothetical protein [Nitrososphaerota archaeon]
MPLLTIDDILLDADIADSFTVRRRQQVIDTNGRAQVTEIDYANIVGVVNAGDPNDLHRDNAEFELAWNTISIVTNFTLVCVLEGYLPDIISWRGGNYTVNNLNEYPQFGPGFVQAVCTNMDRIESMNPSYVNGQLIFSTTNDSGLIGIL